MSPLHRSFCALVLASTAHRAAAPGPTPQRAHLALAPVTIVGHVVDSSGTAIGGAELTVVGTDVVVRSDSLGVFVMSRIARGTQHLRVRRLGYEPRMIAIDAAAVSLDTLLVEIDLDPAVVTLPEVEVAGKALHYNAKMAGFMERMNRGDVSRSQFITRDEIDRMLVSRTSDIFHRRGARVQKCMGGTVWLDGVMLSDKVQTTGLPSRRQPPVSGGTALNRLVQPSEIDGIEIYAGPSEVPAQFNVTGRPGLPPGCVIVIWTR
jgi:carboxypeptidase family protein